MTSRVKILESNHLLQFSFFIMFFVSLLLDEKVLQNQPLIMLLCVYVFCIFTPLLSAFLAFHRKDIAFLNLTFTSDFYS